MLVAQVGDDPAQRAPAVDHEVVLRADGAPLGLERQLARLVEVGVEAPDCSQHHAQRQQALVAELGSELARALRGVVLEIQRPRGVGNEGDAGQQPRLHG